MVDLGDVAGYLLHQPGDPEEPPRPRQRSVQLMSEVGSRELADYHLDYSDPDHVFRLTLRRVPRIRLPLGEPPLVRTVDGVAVVLASVGLANHVEVRLDALPGPARDAATSAFRQTMDAWSQAAAVDPSLDHPPWPSDAYMWLPVEVSDDAGTTYRFDVGNSGGDGTEWVAERRYRPVPPPEASALTVTVRGDDVVTVTLALPGR
jgi:hypothetical protein